MSFGIAFWWLCLKFDCIFHVVFWILFFFFRFLEDSFKLCIAHCKRIWMSYFQVRLVLQCKVRLVAYIFLAKKEKNKIIPVLLGQITSPSSQATTSETNLSWSCSWIFIYVIRNKQFTAVCLYSVGSSCDEGPWTSGRRLLNLLWFWLLLQYLKCWLWVWSTCLEIKHNKFQVGKSFFTKFFGNNFF